MTTTADPGSRTVGVPSRSRWQTRPPRFVAELGSWGNRVAAHGQGQTLTYAQLDDLVDDHVLELDGDHRELVVIAAENSLDWLVTYLAALRAGHVVLLTPGDRPEHLERLVETYRPGFVASPSPAGWTVQRQAPGPAPALHPDLTLLLPTSGSTGAPKLVRLSGDNLDANARSIVEALGITDDDRAITSLPVHYSYGLSVVHSHLAAGASLVLSDFSVIDPCFWELVRRTEVTSIAGVPHTYDLLDQVGFASMDVPSLRTLTQAGGPLRPESAERYRTLADRNGWRFFTMYGQTEATARMAVLPPELATQHPDAVGVAVPGGSFRVEPLDGDSAPATDATTGLPVGELVYRGPNVMLGYAACPDDLALPRQVHELRTGDLGTVDADGVVRVVGRRSRFAKVLGLRLDLDHLERDLGDARGPVRCVDLDGRLGVATPVAGRAPELREQLRRRHGIPLTSLVVADGCEIPVLANGKPDDRSLRARLAAHEPDPAGAAVDEAPGDLCDEVVALYRTLLGRDDAAPTTSFVDLGGDSLSYVEVSIRLEGLVGTLPSDWHRLAPRDLAATANRRDDDPERTPRWRRLETSVVLRALAVLLILANHTKLADVPGGAHTLLVIAGYNLARFQLTDRPARDRARGILTGMWRIWAPSAVWIALVAVVVGTYDWRNVLMLNQVLGDWARWSPHWHFWYIEAVLALLLGATALTLVPAFDRLERRHQFAVPMVLVGLGLLTRYAVVVPDAGPYRGANAYVLLWLFATGWAAARATTAAQRVLLSAVPVLTLPGFWPTMPGREATIIAGVLLLIWVPNLPVPRRLASTVSAVASASLFVYLTHFVVYPHVMDVSSGLAVLASLAGGLAYWKAWTGGTAWLQRVAAPAARRTLSRLRPASSQRLRVGRPAPAPRP